MTLDDKVQTIAWLSAVHFCITAFAFFLLGRLTNANADKNYKLMQLQSLQELNEIKIETLKVRLVETLKVRLDTQSVLGKTREFKSVPKLDT